MPSHRQPQKPRSRTLVLLLSCGLWLLYFDLLTSMPGCASSDDGAKIEAVDASPLPSSSIDAPSGDGNATVEIDSASPAVDGAPEDTGTVVDGAGIDSGGVDGAPVDGGAIVDGPIVDGALVDGPVLDAPVDGPPNFVDSAMIDSGFIVDAADIDAPPDA